MNVQPSAMEELARQYLELAFLFEQHAALPEGPLAARVWVRAMYETKSEDYIVVDNRAAALLREGAAKGLVL